MGASILRSIPLKRTPRRVVFPSRGLRQCIAFEYRSFRLASRGIHSLACQSRNIFHKERIVVNSCQKAIRGFQARWCSGAPPIISCYMLEHLLAIYLPFTSRLIAQLLLGEAEVRILPGLSSFFLLALEYFLRCCRVRRARSCVRIGQACGTLRVGKTAKRFHQARSCCATCWR